MQRAFQQSVSWYVWPVTQNVSPNPLLLSASPACKLILHLTVWLKLGTCFGCHVADPNSDCICSSLVCRLCRMALPLTVVSRTREN